MSSPELQPSLPPLFLDRSLGRNVVADALRDAGATVKIHDDHFSPDEQDAVWITDVGKRGWVILTKDSRIKYRETERVAVQRAGVAMFVLTSGDLRGNEMATAFVKALPHIAQCLLRGSPPFIAKVYRDGQVRMDTDFAE